MNETNTVPPEIKLEAANLEIEKLKAQVQRFAGLVAEMMIEDDLTKKVGKIMADSLVEIVHIKGEPPIQVARTIARKSIDACAKLVIKRYEETEDTTNHNPVLPGPIHPEGPEECKA